jgi:uncharacterized protein YxeA
MDPIVLVLMALALIIVGVLFFLNKNKKSGMQIYLKAD